MRCVLEHERPARHAAVLEEAGKRRADWKVASRLANMGKLVLGAFPSGTHHPGTKQDSARRFTEKKRLS